MIFNREQVEEIRANHPAGTKVKLAKMNGDPYPVEPGMSGVVSHVDDIGTIHVNWENGSTLGLIPGLDEFSVVTNKPRV